MYLEAVWGESLEQAGKQHLYTSIFSSDFAETHKSTRWFLALSRGFFALGTREELKTSHGKLKALPDYKEDSERQSLTAFDENDDTRRAMMKLLLKNEYTYTSFLDCWNALQSELEGYKKTRAEAYKELDIHEMSNAFLIFMRKCFGLAPINNMETKAPNSLVTHIALPVNIHRCTNPCSKQNTEIYDAQNTVLRIGSLESVRKTRSPSVNSFMTGIFPDTKRQNEIEEEMLTSLRV